MFQKVWWIEKVALSLHHCSLRNGVAFENGSLIYWL